MKITGYDTWVAGVPYDEGRIGTHFVLKLHTDDGIEGISYVSRIGATTASAFLSVLKSSVDLVVGDDPLHIEAIGAKLFRRGGALPGYQGRAASAIDVACWDIKGKVLNQPVHKLLGGFRDTIDCYASWEVEPREDMQAVARNTEKHLKHGFKSMKWHTRSLPLDHLLKHMRLIRDIVGDDVDVMVDVTQLWKTKQAIQWTKALEPMHPYWIEDVVPKEDYYGLRQVSEAIDTPTCAGEGYRDIADFGRLMEHRSVDIAMVDLDVGLTGALKVAHLAEVYGKPIVPHLATEILAHLIAAVPNGLTVEYLPWAEPLFQGYPELREGQLHLSNRPGLGMELDMAGLKHYAVE